MTDLDRTIAYAVGVVVLLVYVAFILTGMARSPITSRALALIAAGLAAAVVVMGLSALLKRRKR